MILFSSHFSVTVWTGHFGEISDYFPSIFGLNQMGQHWTNPLLDNNSVLTQLVTLITDLSLN